MQSPCEFSDKDVLATFMDKAELQADCHSLLDPPRNHGLYLPDLCLALYTLWVNDFIRQDDHGVIHLLD